ncbi:helix-turn-helix domain-containing protein [Streptomyces sp. NPDC016734]|uniref:helix-turn-helix domain-containing protein n=1 Tax=Streptomyces TaxID=1883 RepID=UPI0037BD9929
MTVRPRRTRCVDCGLSHVLLPVFALFRRADLAEVIGSALAAKAAGAGARVIAERLGRPVETVRGWLRRFASRAEGNRRFFTVLLVDAGVDPAVPGPSRTLFADAVVGAWWSVAERRQGVALGGGLRRIWRHIAGAFLAAGNDQHEPTLTPRR